MLRKCLGTSVTSLVIMLVTMVVVPLAAQEDMQTPTLFFADAWARPTVNEAGESITDVSAAYMMILNNGDSDALIVSASSPAAELVQLHEVVMDGDVMQMRELEDGLMLPAGEITTLQPGGFHVMLMGVTEPLVEGEAISVTLTLEDGTDIVIGVPVQNRLTEMSGG